MPYVLSKKRRSRKLVTSIYYFGTNLSDTKGYDQSANSSAFVIISLEVIAILVVTIKSDFDIFPFRNGLDDFIFFISYQSVQPFPDTAAAIILFYFTIRIFSYIKGLIIYFNSIFFNKKPVVYGILNDQP